MKIEHIVWEDSCHDDVSKGILEIEVYWHGGGTTVILMQGTYVNNGRGSFSNEFVTIDYNTMGVSGVGLRRVGKIVE